MIRAVALALLLAAPVPTHAEDAVGRVNVAGYNSRSMCSGTLIAADLVLTAAHCVSRAETGAALPVKDMVFVAGWDGAGHAGAARAASVRVHPLAYAQGPLALAHDVALITLAEPLSPAPLRLADAPPGGPVSILGYKRSRPHRLDVQTPCAVLPSGALMRLSCAVERGQSGGPVLHDGQIVAVTVAARQGEALAVPINDWLRSAAQR